MHAIPAKKSPAANGRRSFTWGVQASEVRWMKPAGAGPAIDGSTASDCQSILPANPRRRRKATPEAA